MMSVADGQLYTNYDNALRCARAVHFEGDLEAVYRELLLPLGLTRPHFAALVRQNLRLIWNKKKTSLT